MIEWVTDIVVAGGWPAVLALMFLENLFPPIPSEVIMPLAGFAAAQGRMSFTMALAAGIAGTLLGNAFWYETARIIHADRVRPWIGRYGRWFAVGEDDLLKAERTLQKHGPVALCFGRLLPGIRTLISIPAVLIHIPRSGFYLWTTLGTTIWLTILCAAGYALETQYERVAEWLDPLGTVVIVGFVGAYAWHIWKTRLKTK